MNRRAYPSQWNPMYTILSIGQLSELSGYLLMVIDEIYLPVLSGLRNVGGTWGLTGTITKFKGKKSHIFYQQILVSFPKLFSGSETMLVFPTYPTIPYPHI